MSLWTKSWSCLMSLGTPIFKHNFWFGRTNRRMLDTMANHATRVRRYQDLYGINVVEEFIDVCLSLENLIDLHAPYRPKPLRKMNVQRATYPTNLLVMSTDCHGLKPKNTWMNTLIPTTLSKSNVSVIKTDSKRDFRVNRVGMSCFFSCRSPIDALAAQRDRHHPR